MLKEDDIRFIMNSFKNEQPKIEQEIVNELTEEEAIKIYNELLEVLSRHNLSYKCAFNVTISLMYSFMVGAAELYDIEEESPNGEY